MIYGWNKKVNRKLQTFAAPAVLLTRAEMSSLIKNTPEIYMRIWTTKLSGAGMRRMMKTGPFPGGPKGPLYDYEAKGYWVLMTNEGWRTIVLKNVEKVKLGNQVYKIK